MFCLGIETSCDETSAAVVKDGREVLSNVVSSSLKEHSKYGGIVPEIACRAQVEVISMVVREALSAASATDRDIGAVGVTYGPGLVGALLVGVSFAKALGFFLGIPVMGVNHLQAHLYANFLVPQKRVCGRKTGVRGTSGGVRSSGRRGPRFPYLGLVISGGHTSIVWMKDFSAGEILGETTDDAAGEAFDKVAKILGLGYPGGPEIERRAVRGKPDKIPFPRSTGRDSLDFSFSGLKTAVLYYVKKCHGTPLKHSLVCDIAASFQSAVGDALVSRTQQAVRRKRAKRLVLGGGVSVNAYLRGRFQALAEEENLELHIPEHALCMDNGAMVAGLAYRLFREGKISGLELTAVPDLDFSD